MFAMPPPIEKEIPQLGFPYKFSEVSPSVRLRPPLLGEHAVMIFNQRLGMSEEEIGKLVAENIVIASVEKSWSKIVG